MTTQLQLINIIIIIIILFYCKTTLHILGVTAPIIRGRVEMESDGTRWRTGGEVKGKEANEEGS